MVEIFCIEELCLSCYNRVSKQTEDMMRDYRFGNFLHELRLRRGLTQYQLGALVGVSDKAVSKWENGSSKPQSDILYQLSDILGISVDELLTCKYHSSEKKAAKGVFAMKKQLWDKAFAALSERYGDPAPMEMTNRLLTEYAEMQNTDMIVWFDLLSVLSSTATTMGEHIRVRGGTGASFAAYLLGATEINPLHPHYFCPGCHTAIFDRNADDGWDLPEKRCSCGKVMRSDGHSIPFETYRHVVRKNTSFDISVSPKYLSSAENIVQDYFGNCRLTKEEREPDKVISFRIASEKSACSVTLCADDDLARCKALENATATCFERVRFATADVVKEFREGNTDGITGFGADFMKNMLRTVSPGGFGELIKISGLAHGTGVWLDNGEQLMENGRSVTKLIAYRDDVFRYVRDKMLVKGFADTGFAYRVMEDTRRGIYAQSGVPEDIGSLLRSVGAEDWWIGSIGKIRYLFPKAHGVACVRSAAILMWYKMHYPKEFGEIMA